MATPVVVYGLELWEHAPAAACVMVAAVLTFPWLPPSGGSFVAPRAGKHMLAGAAIMAGFLFREEVISALPAFAIARAISVERDRVKELIATGLWMTAGAAVVFLASVPFNLLIYGAPLPMHITQDAWEVAKNTPYMQVRRDVVVDLLLPGSHPFVFLLAAAVALGVSLTQARASAQMDDARSAWRLNLLHACVVVIFTISVVLPLWSLVTLRSFVGTYRSTSAIHTWPFAIAILYLPWIDRDAWPSARFLVVSALLILLGSALVIPTSGGGQWSPRFLLASAPLLAVVAARPALAIANRARSQALPGIVWMSRGILIGSLVMQVTGIALFRHAKMRHAEMAAWVANRTAPGSVLITDVFWFHELTAMLSPTRRTLFSWSSADVPALAAIAVQHGIDRFAVVSSVPLTGYDPPAVLDVPGAPCRFVRGQRIGLDRNGLTLSRYGCEGP